MALLVQGQAEQKNLAAHHAIAHTSGWAFILGGQNYNEDRHLSADVAIRRSVIGIIYTARTSTPIS